VQRCLAHGDFVEGVRALLIDKDQAPRWQPRRLADVDAAALSAFFAPVAQGDPKRLP
jgi:enoyl-CoA hydratase